MGKMKFLSESIPPSSEVFWNQIRIVLVRNQFPESILGLESGPQLALKSELVSEPDLSPKSESTSKSVSVSESPYE